MCQNPFARRCRAFRSEPLLRFDGSFAWVGMARNEATDRVGLRQAVPFEHQLLKGADIQGRTLRGEEYFTSKEGNIGNHRPHGG